MATKVKLIADNVITTDQIDLTSIDTDNLSEGSTNLYFTNARVDSHLSGGTGVTYSSGAISIGQAVATDSNVTFADLTVTGDLNITGDINSYNVTDLDVTDQTITLGAGQIEANSGGSGIIVDGSNASILWDETNDQFDINKGLNVTGEAEFANKLKVYAENNALIAIDSLSNAYMVIDRSADNRRGALVFSTAAADVFSAPPATGAINWALGVGDSDELSGNKFAIKAGNTNFANAQFVIDTSGNVGIGATDPSEILQIEGATVAGGNNYIYLRKSDQAVNQGVLIGQGTNNNDLKITQKANNSIIFEIGATPEEAVRINESGRVGIGTGSETLHGLLNVKGGVNSIGAYSTVATDQPGLFVGNNSAFNTSTNTLYAKIYGSGITASAFGVTLGDYAVLATDGTDNNGLVIGSFNNAPVIFGTNNTNRMTLTADGKLNLNVALTKSSGPVLDLEPNANIDGSYYSALTINEQHSTAHSGVRFDRSGTPKYRVGIDNNDNFQIANFRTTTDDAAFVMDVDSDIGIGTASPATSLHIHRDSNENSPEIRITTGKDSGTPMAQMSYSAGSGYFLRLPDAANNEDVMIRSYGDTVFHGGSVSIGEQLKVGSFGYGQTNTGEAWIGRASDRNEGTLTFQLGGGTTGRKFEIVDHDWQKVIFNIDGNADNGAVQIPATGVDGITINNTHAGTEPYNNLHLRSLSTIGGIGLYSTNQSHVRFKTGGGSGNWGNGQGYQWQLRMGKGSGLDNMQIYSWTGNRGVQEWHGSTGNIEMPYQAGARYGLPSNQTISTTTSVINYSDTNSTYGCYQRNGISSSSGTITVTHAGIYDFAIVMRTEATPFRAPTQIRYMVDNSGTGSGTFVSMQRLYITSNTQSSFEHAPPFQAKFQLVAGARVQVTADTGSGSFILSSTSNTVNFLTINKIA